MFQKNKNSGISQKGLLDSLANELDEINSDMFRIFIGCIINDQNYAFSDLITKL